MPISAQTFPGVYSRLIDRSFITPPASRYKVGLLGVAKKGPFNQVVQVRSLQDFRRVFGDPVSGRYLAHAVAILSSLTDGVSVVRVGNEYETLSTGDVSGSSGTYQVYTPNSAFFTVGNYVRVTQPGKTSTVNARISSVPGTNDHLVLTSVGSEAKSLADTYTAATLAESAVSEASNEAEASLYAYEYDAELSLAGDVVGDKNAYRFTVDGDESLLAAGDLIKIEQDGRATTREVRIKEVRASVGGTATILLETSNNTEVGYQSFPLQDSYSAGRISKVSTSGGSPVTALAIPLLAATAGTWANSNGSTTGLVVTVGPGSKPDTKKVNVYLNSSLVEAIDNLSTDSSSADYYTTRIAGNSSYITIPSSFTITDHPANTVNPWNLSAADPLNVAAFVSGFDGDTPTAADVIGTIDPSDDTATGLKLFEDAELGLDVIAVPDAVVLFASNDTAVAQELARIARSVFAFAWRDVPAGLNLREAVDWHNGEGLYAALGRIDNYALGVCWNWFDVVSTFDGSQLSVPPSLGFMRAQAYTFDAEKPWFAAAGERRGVLPEAVNLAYAKISEESKAASYGEGNSINSIIFQGGRIMTYGDRTIQRAESKLSSVHNVILSHYILRNLARIGRAFVWEPLDDELLDQLRLAYDAFLAGVQVERGLEEYLLTIDETNNTTATRNLREVIVDLSFIPTNAVERIFINATVRESGAVLNSIT